MRALVLLPALALLLPVTTSADPVRCIPAVLSLAESDSDPWAPSAGTPFLGERDLYLWLWNYIPDRVTFGLEGTLEVLELEPAQGWNNTGTLESPRLERTGCEGDWKATLLARVRVNDPTGAGGRLCFGESGLDGIFCFDTCSGLYYVLDGFGYATDGGPGCSWVYSPECEPLAVDDVSWGEAKARFR